LAETKQFQNSFETVFFPVTFQLCGQFIAPWRWTTAATIGWW